MRNFASGRLLSVQFDTGDVSDQISNATIESADGDTDFLTFAAARAGGNKDYTFKGTIGQDYAVGSVYRECWDSVGDTVPMIMAPYGNTVASPTQPHVGFSVIISEPGTLAGGEAAISPSSAHTVEVEWKLTGRPVLITA